MVDTVEQPQVEQPADVTMVKGVRVRYNPYQARKNQKPWGVWIEVTFSGKKPIRREKPFWTQAEAWAYYPFAAAEVTQLRTEHEAVVAATRAVVPELPPAPKGSVLFETLALRWLDEAVRPPWLQAGTYLFYKSHLQNHLFPIMRTWPVTAQVMSRDRLKKVLKVDLRATGASLGTRKACQRTLSAFFQWATTELPGQLPTNPAHDLTEKMLADVSEVGKKKKSAANPMSEAQRDAFLAWQEVHYPETYEVFLWLALQGNRVGEVTALKWDWLRLGELKAEVKETHSFALRTLQIAAGDETGLGEKGTKTDSEYKIDLHPLVGEKMTALKKRNYEAWLASPRRYGKPPAHCFLNRCGKPRRRDNTIIKAFHEGCAALAEVGLKTVGDETGQAFTIHCLRDTFITLAILDGHDMFWVAHQVGHNNVETLKKHYLKWVQRVAVNPFLRRATK